MFCTGSCCVLLLHCVIAQLRYEERFFFIMRLATLISFKVHCVILLMLVSAHGYFDIYLNESQVLRLFSSQKNWRLEVKAIFRIRADIDNINTDIWFLTNSITILLE